MHGIVLEKKVGSKVYKGDILAYIHTNDKEKVQKASEDLKTAYVIGEHEPVEYEHILGII